MGLSQLLAVSRSVRTIKDGPARYKMTQQNLLPKFAAERAGPNRPEASGTEAVLAPPSVPAAPVPAPTPPVPAEPVPTAPVVEYPEAVAGGAGAASVPPAGPVD